MKFVAFVLFHSLIGKTGGCPHLGYTVGGENPHQEEKDAKVEAEYGSLRQPRRRVLAGGGGGGTKRPTPSPRTSRPTPGVMTSAPSPAPKTSPPTPTITGPERFEGTVEEGIASAKAETIAMMTAEPSLGAKFVRLAFHDCVGPNGCNGCINLGNPDNGGLLLPMGRLCTMCGFYSSVMTRADCWALAALTALDVNQPDPSNKIDFELFHVGRPTCADGNLLGDSLMESAVFPSPHVTSDQLVNFFALEFGFSPEETVAIMGAHTLGTLSNLRSGFSGAWVHGERIVDNEFYRFLVDSSDPTLPSSDYVLENTGNGNGQYSWTHNGGVTGDRPEIMLNADMALVRNFAGFFADVVSGGQDVSSSGQVTCVLSDDGSGQAAICPTAPEDMMSKVTEYSESNDLWLAEFHTVFIKMITNGHDTSNCQEGILCELTP